MKVIYLLFLTSFFIKLSLSSLNTTIEITGKAEVDDKPCDKNNKLFSFHIPFKFQEDNSEDYLTFNLKLSSPPGQSVTCTYEAYSTRQLFAELNLECSLDVSSFVLYEENIKFYSKYDSSDFGNINVIGWEEKIGNSPIVYTKASCPSPLYIMKNIYVESDTCYGNYHSITLSGDLTVKNEINNYLASSEELNFEMIVNLSSLPKKARCKYTTENSKLQCTFEGDGTIRSSIQMVSVNGEYMYLEPIQTESLIKRCNKYSLTDISVDYEECQNKTHYLNLNGNLKVRNEIIPPLAPSYIPHFQIEVKLNSQPKKLNCKLLEVKRKGKNSLLECSFKVNANFQFDEQNIAINNDDYIYVQSTPLFATKTCSSSWISLPMILLFTLILL